MRTGQFFAMSPIVLLITCLMAVARGRPSETVRFFEDGPSKVDDNIITPPVLPVIDHLENDPTTLTKEDIEKRARHRESANFPSKMAISTNFNYSPDENGDLSITYNRGFSGNFGDNLNRAGSHSVKVDGSFDKGFKVQHSSSSSRNEAQNSAFFGSSGISASGSITTNHGTAFATRLGDSSASSSLGFPPGEAEKFFKEILQHENFNGQGFSTPIKSNPVFEQHYPAIDSSQVNSIPSTHEVHFVNLEPRDSGRTIRFPGESTDRFSNVQYQTVPVYNENKKKPSVYDVIRIEV